MVVNGWKIVAWIFIIICIAETSLIIWSYNYASNSIDKELECSNDICYEVDAASYIYDTPSNICYCYNSDKEIIKQKYLK